MAFFNLSTCIANDWKRFDNIITVTLKDFDGGVTSVQGVVSQPLNKKQTAMVMQAVGVDDETQSFSLPVANLSGVEPQQGNRVVDNNGVVWNVLSCELLTLDTRWMLACVRNRSEYVSFNLSLSYQGTNGTIGAGQFNDDGNNPRNFVIGDASANYFAGKLQGSPGGGTEITLTGNSGTIVTNVYSVVFNGDGTTTINTILSLFSSPIPWQIDESVSFSITS